MSRPPVPSSAVVLRRDGRVYWMRRRPEFRFMGLFHTFPGGKVDPEDFDFPVERVPEGVEKEYFVSAVREVFEETGWLAVEGGCLPERAAALRKRLLEGELDFAGVLRDVGAALDASPFRRAGTWTTPAFQNIRFTSVYLTADVPAGVELSVNPREHLEGEWIEPVRALRRYEDGRATLPPPVVYCLKKLVAHFGDEEGLARALAHPPTRFGRDGKRIEFRAGIQLVPLKSPTLPPATHTNLHIVGRDKLFFIDPSPVDEGERALLNDYCAQLRAEGMSPHKILLTHHHVDHVSAALRLRETLGVPIAASAATRDLLAGRVPVDEIVSDGDMLEAGERWRLKAIATPGHAPGHLCFLELHTGTLFAGDMISGFGTVLIDPADGGHMRTYLRSLRRLIDEPGYDLLLPAHGGSISAPRTVLEETIRHRAWREARVLRAFERSPDSLDAIVAEAYGDVRPEALPYARRSTLAILEKLEEDARVPAGTFPRLNA